MGINTDFKIDGLTTEESNQLFGYIGESNTSGMKFSRVYAREGTNPYCGYEKYTIKDFLSKKDQLIKCYEEEGRRDIDALELGLSLLEKLFDKDTEIRIDWS